MSQYDYRAGVGGQKENRFLEALSGFSAAVKAEIASVFECDCGDAEIATFLAKQPLSDALVCCSLLFDRLIDVGEPGEQAARKCYQLVRLIVEGDSQDSDESAAMSAPGYLMGEVRVAQHDQRPIEVGQYGDSFRGLFSMTPSSAPTGFDGLTAQVLDDLQNQLGESSRELVVKRLRWMQKKYLKAQRIARSAGASRRPIQPPPYYVLYETLAPEEVRQFLDDVPGARIVFIDDAVEAQAEEEAQLRFLLNELCAEANFRFERLDRQWARDNSRSASSESANSPLAAISELLVSCFSVSELRRFFPSKSLPISLPEGPIERDDLAFKAVTALKRKGLLRSSKFWDAWQNEVPHRGDEIRALREQVQRAEFD